MKTMMKDIKLTTTICIGYRYKTGRFANKFSTIIGMNYGIIIQMIININGFACICITCFTIFFDPTNKI